MNTEAWTALAVRCEQASGADRETDLTILNKTGRAAFPYRWSEAFGDCQVRIGTYALPPILEADSQAVAALVGNDERSAIIVPSYTASLDAIVALIERELPGWGLRIGLSEGLKHPVVTISRSYPTNKVIPVEGKTLPLTLCAAFCRAMASRPAKGGDHVG